MIYKLFTVATLERTARFALLRVHAVRIEILSLPSNSPPHPQTISGSIIHKLPILVEANVLFPKRTRKQREGLGDLLREENKQKESP